jgi:hypothetical protein
MKFINQPINSSIEKTFINAMVGGGGSNVIQRYFSEFFSAQSQYLESTSDINITGDYEVKGLVYKAAGKAVILFGNKTSFHSRCLINADGSVNFRAGDTDADELTTSSGLVPDNKLSTIYVKRAGTTGTITVNAETPVTGTVTALDAVINTIQRSNTLYGDSRTADLKLWTGNKETGSLIVDLAIDGDGSSNTVVNAANPSNNFTRVNMTTANASIFVLNSGEWLDTVDLWEYGDYTYVGSESQFSLLVGTGSNPHISVGSNYKYEMAPSLSGGGPSSQIRLRIGGSVARISEGLESDGSIQSGTFVVASGEALFIQTGSDPQYESGIIRGVSVIEIMEIAE